MAEYISNISVNNVDYEIRDQRVDQLSAEKVTRPATAQVGQVIAVKAVDADGKPTEWEAVDMSGGGVQPDWNQNDETAADFIENKPFGDSLVEIMPETEVTGEPDGEIYFATLETAQFSGTEETLIVTFDGVAYTCANVSGYFGNFSVVGADDTGEPFLILSVEGGVYLFDGEPHTIKIVNREAKKIEPKYIDFLKTFYIASASKDAVNYMYSDMACTTKVTRDDFLQCMGKYFIVLATPNGSAHFFPQSAAIDGTCGWFTAVTESGVVSFHTAEYTPTT